MEETLKDIIECVFTKLDKVERLNKLDNLRKILCSEFEIHRGNCFTLSELIDDISLMIDAKETDVGTDPMSIHKDRSKESELFDKFNELRNSILSTFLERSNVLFYAPIVFLISLFIVNSSTFAQDHFTTNIIIFFSSFFTDNYEFLLKYKLQ